MRPPKPRIVTRDVPDLDEKPAPIVNPHLPGPPIRRAENVQIFEVTNGWKVYANDGTELHVFNDWSDLIAHITQHFNPKGRSHA